jgi:hypothetical protein
LLLLLLPQGVLMYLLDCDDQLAFADTAVSGSCSSRQAPHVAKAAEQQRQYAASSRHSM